MTLVCWGIYRELAHSPGRESDDALILRGVAGHLESLGHRVRLMMPEEAAEAADRDVPPFVFAMCERLPILARLRSWEEAGTLLVNGTEGILNTYRDRTLARFRREGVPFPGSALVSTTLGVSRSPQAPHQGVSPPETPLPGPRYDLPLPCWVKRADVHQTQAGDVTFAGSAEAMAAALAGLAARGIAQAVLQEHVPGDLIKFYGVGNGPDSWFTWFYHRDQALAGHSFDELELAAAARLGARSLGLEIYGGDAIASPGGRVVLVDLNAWPSFALFRAEASARIAEHLVSLFGKHAELQSGVGVAARVGAVTR